jgi:hypothetical protein
MAANIQGSNINTTAHFSPMTWLRQYKGLRRMLTEDRESSRLKSIILQSQREEEREEEKENSNHYRDRPDSCRQEGRKIGSSLVRRMRRSGRDVHAGASGRLSLYEYADDLPMDRGWPGSLHRND